MRMHALDVMHTRTLCENVDSAKIKVLFYTTDIDILQILIFYMWHRCIVSSYIVSIYRSISMNCYTPFNIRSVPLAQPKMPFGNLLVLNLWNRLSNSLSKLVFTQVDEHRCC